MPGSFPRRRLGFPIPVYARMDSCLVRGTRRHLAPKSLGHIKEPSQGLADDLARSCVLRLGALFDCLPEVRIEPYWHHLRGPAAEHGSSSLAGLEDLWVVTPFGIIGHGFDVGVGEGLAGSGSVGLLSHADQKPD